MYRDVTVQILIPGKYFIMYLRQAFDLAIDLSFSQKASIRTILKGTKLAMGGH